MSYAVETEPPLPAAAEELQYQLRLFEKRTRNNLTYAGGGIDFANRNMALTPQEQGRVIKLLVQRIDYNGDTGRLEITFRPNGFLEQFSEKAVA